MDDVILSSADILGILGGNAIIRLSAGLSVTDGRPSLSGREGIYIYVERFPSVQEFEATWTIYIESDEEVDLVVAEIKRLLPKVQVEPGLLTVVKTTDFRSESTQTAPEAPKVKAAQVDLTQYEERFQSLVEDVQDQMLLVSSGRPGKDGKDGQSGRDGRDGKDIDATQTELFDLKDVDESPLPLEKGQVLTWDGSKWTNLYTRTVTSLGGGGGGGEGGGGSGIPEAPQDGQQYARQDASWTVVEAGGGGGGIEEAPQDGDYYVRQNGAWVNLKIALDQYGITVDDSVDGGNFTTGKSNATNTNVIDGGNFTSGSSAADSNSTLDGGNYTTGDSGSSYGL